MESQSLFAGAIEESAEAAGPFAGVALEQGIDRVLDYSVPPRLLSQLKVGQRVRVPLGRGNKITDGYVVSIHSTTDYPRIKPLADLKDDRVLVAPKLMALARWMSRYYVTPLGIVLESIIPSAVKKRIGIGYLQIVSAARQPDELQAVIEKTRAPKRRAVLARLLQLEPGTGIELIRLAGESGTTPATVRKLARLGLIKITQEVDLPRLTGEAFSSSPMEQDIILNDDQRAVFDELKSRVDGGGFSVNLLHGVTGSGKTEIYLQCIRRVIESGKQAIVMVPEIALTPQTVKRFTARFPRVAILHSGLTATERHRYWQRISQGEADVVVGARSSVFSPMRNLGIIVVDEEHDASYKQDTAPRYQGRDVAVKRAQLEGIPILLGSATPSLETYWRVVGEESAKSESAGNSNALRATKSTDQSPSPSSPSVPSPYHFLSLPSRVRGLQLPKAEVIDMSLERRMRRGVHLLSKRLEHMLQTTLANGQQAILLLNRRGYSNFVYCASCQNVIQCKYCDTTMTYHRSAASEVHDARFNEALHSGQLNCHYCLATTPLPSACPTCGKKLSLFGLGTQRVEEELQRKFPDLKFARVDSDSMHSAKDYEALLNRFARKEIQVLLGTQMIAKGLDYPNVTLVGVISGDTALSLPDFRAAERTFQLITQVAGRAGRGDAAGRVIVQTFLPDDPSIQLAIRQDFLNFAATELKHRKETSLPPITRMVRIILRDQDPEKLHTISEQLAAAVNQGLTHVHEEVRVKGPMPCAINRIAGYFRNQIVMTAARSKPLQQLLAHLREAGALGKAERIAVDVDPVSLL